MNPQPQNFYNIVYKEGYPETSFYLSTETPLDKEGVALLSALLPFPMDYFEPLDSNNQLKALKGKKVVTLEEVLSWVPPTLEEEIKEWAFFAETLEEASLLA